MPSRKTTLRASIAFFVGALFAALAAFSSACGGCYVDDEVTDLHSDPAAACIGLSATTPDVCSASYDILVQNECAETLTLGGVVIAAGANGSVQGGSAEARDGQYVLAGTLGSDPIEVLWRLTQADR